MSAVELASAAKSYGKTAVLSQVSLSVPEGAIAAVLGQSGSGKTTLLRTIAGLERLDTGTLHIGGLLVDDGRRVVPAQRRRIGYVPQEGALFPHLSVAGNIGFGLARRDRGRIADLVDLVGLSGLERRYPHQLSGGQQQRVALVRALAIEPSVVLLDEPFSSLDASLRGSLRRDVVRILRQTGTTAIVVTHDQDEALSIADQIAVLEHGHIVASGEPRDLYSAPPSAAAARYLGSANIVSAIVDGSQAHCAFGTVALHDGATDGPARLLLRPEQLAISDTKINGSVRAVVTELQYHGHDSLVNITSEQQSLLVRIEGETRFDIAQEVWVHARGIGRTFPQTEVADSTATSTGS